MTIAIRNFWIVAVVFRSLFVGLIATLTIEMLLVMGVFAYGIAFAPQQIDIVVAPWRILSFTSAGQGGFEMTFPQTAGNMFVALNLLASLLWLVSEIASRRHTPMA